jgi:tetratricopeptide (TPR) repeat protein
MFCALLCALSLTTPLPALADEIQEITKLYKQGQAEKALEIINGYLGARPKNARGPKIAQARFMKGLILAEQGKTAEAVRVYQELTEDYPELPEPYNNLAVLYASQGQYDKARTALQMAINTHPSYAAAHENLGDIYAKMASQAYDKALQLERGNTAAQAKLTLVKELFSNTGRANRPPAKIEQAPLSLPAAPPAPKVAAAPAAPPAPTAAERPRPQPPKPVAETKPAPVVPPAGKPEARESQDKADKEAILKTLDAWAKAWSDKNASAYLAHYARDFKTPGQSRAAWEKTRRDRISRPKFIHVYIDNVQVRIIDPTRASATFRQTYKSDTLQTATTKTMELVKIGANWLIQQERVGR